MKHLFIPYELAVIAKEKGFNEDCIGCYASFYSSTEPDFYTEMKEEFVDFDVFIVAPMHQQIVDWFREKHKVLIYVVPFKDHAADVNDTMLWNYGIHNHKVGRNIETYYTALNKAIEEAFKLI